LGLDLPINRCVVAHGRLVARLGPDEWIFIAPEDHGEPLGREIERGLAGSFYAVTDISHRQVGIEVDGPAAAEILNVGCPLDLHASSFPAGSATRTVLGKAEIMLMRPSAALIFRIEVWRSFSAYTLLMLKNAAGSPM
jgi:sarcosine oxidase subunit gamma